MALWILNRPAEFGNSAELRVAELLARLSDDWTVRWGFYYQDNGGVTREGDFLVLGPDGGLMVIEVKGGALEVFPANGRWNDVSTDHPLFQLDGEWKAVVNRVNEQRGPGPTLFVAKALALPDLNLSPDLASYHEIPRDLILCEPDLRDFPATWGATFKRLGFHLEPRARAVFFASYGQEVTPVAMRHFVDDADRALLRHTESNYELLDQLAENRQFLVKGGSGSGKTWLAFEQARRWAEQSPAGSRILLLCYNLALTDFLREMAAKAKARGRPAKGTVEVLSWEDLARSLMGKAGLPFEVPEDAVARIEFFTHTLPSLMVQAAHENFCRPEYDGLVVDEGQDHDTGMEAYPPRWQGPGWWGIYWKLLHEGAAARIAVFYDPAQRPVFRNATTFDDAALCRALQANPVRIQLLRSVRYSRPVLNFLKNLRSPVLAPLTEALQQRGTLPEGPDVITEQASRTDVPKVVAAIIERWVESGLCRPDEILLLSLHGHPDKSALGECPMLGGCLVRDFLKRQRGCVSRTSVNKAKGLDARAVILVDFPPFSPAATDTLQLSYFMGASRARQLLAIVHTV